MINVSTILCFWFAEDMWLVVGQWFVSTSVSLESINCILPLINLALNALDGYYNRWRLLGN